jgi:ankyrin repeat protein
LVGFFPKDEAAMNSSLYDKSPNMKNHCIVILIVLASFLVGCKAREPKSRVAQEIAIDAKEKPLLFPSRTLKAPIIAAALAGDLRQIRSLVESGVDVNLKDPDGLTALMAATMTRKIDVVEFLLKNGAHVKGVNFLGGTALIDLMNYGMYSDRENSQTEAIKKWHPIMKLMIENGADINEKNKLDESPLLIAVRYRDLESVRIFIKNGADVNAKDELGNTALHLTLYEGSHNSDFDVEMIKLLLENKADVNIKNNTGQTVLALVEVVWTKKTMPILSKLFNLDANPNPK